MLHFLVNGANEPVTYWVLFGFMVYLIALVQDRLDRRRDRIGREFPTVQHPYIFSDAEDRATVRTFHPPE